VPKKRKKKQYELSVYWRFIEPFTYGASFTSFGHLLSILPIPLLYFERLQTSQNNEYRVLLFTCNSACIVMIVCLARIEVNCTITCCMNIGFINFINSGLSESFALICSNSFSISNVEFVCLSRPGTYNF